MGDEPTAGELGRALADLRADFRDDVAQLRSDLNQKVGRERYQSDQGRADDRYAALRADIARVGAEVDGERHAAQRWRDRRDTARKWLIGGLILPLGGILVEIIDGLRSTH